MSVGCEASSTYELTLALDDTIIAQEIHTYHRDVALNEFDITPPQDLEALTTYTLTVNPKNGSGESTVVSFQTGETTLSGLIGAPALSVTDAWYIADFGISHAGATYDLTPAEDPDALSTVYVFGPESDTEPLSSYRVGQFPSWELYSNYIASEDPPDSICLRVAQRDGAGVLSALSEPSCMEAEWRNDPTSGGRCSTIAPLAIGWLSPLLALTVFRRRRD